MEEQEDAVRIAADIGIRHEMLPADEMEEEGFRLNGPDRCFHCKNSGLAYSPTGRLKIRSSGLSKDPMQTMWVTIVPA